MQIFNKADLRAVKTNKGLSECLRQLQRIARSIAATPHERDNSFAQVSAAFLSRAARQAESVLLLEGSFDSWLIVRSFIEGYAVYAWLESEPSERQNRSRLYGDVAYLEAHTLRTRLGRNMGVESTPFSKFIQDAAQSYQELDAKEGMKIAKGEEADPIGHLKRITGKSLKAVFEDLDRKLDSGDTHKVIYELHYSIFSGYHHWSPLYFTISQTGEFEYYDVTPSNYGIGLVTFIGAFIGMCLVADEFFQTGYKNEIIALQQRYENLI